PLTAQPTEPATLAENPAMGANCPYCTKTISPAPKRRRKCPYCQKMIFLRNGVLCTEAAIKAISAREEKDREKLWRERKAQNRKELAKWRKEIRECSKHDLRNAKELAKSRIADFIQIVICEDQNTCDFCKQQAGRRIPIKNC